MFAAASLAADDSQKPTPPVAGGQTRKAESQGGDQSNIQAAQPKEERSQPSSIAEPTQTEEKSPAADETREENSDTNAAAEDETLIRYTFWLMVFTGALAVSTIALFWVTRQAANAALLNAQAAQAAAQAYKVAERAWVSATDLKANDTFGPPDETGKFKRTGIAILLQWTNAGSTPAIRCETSISFNIVYKDVSEEVPRFEPLKGKGPGDVTIIRGVIYSNLIPNIAEKHVVALCEGRCRIYVYCRADYEDVFHAGVRRYVELCSQLEYGGIHKDTGQRNFRFGAIGPQNGAD